jgi:hypothetical protein
LLDYKSLDEKMILKNYGCRTSIKFLGSNLSICKSDREIAIAMAGAKEKKVEYNVESKSGAPHDMDNGEDKVKAGTKAMGRKQQSR